MLQTLAQRLWGDFKSKEECIKFVRLAFIFAFTIGVYWLINPLKDVVFLQTVGSRFLPLAKIFSVFSLLPLLMIYSKLVDLFPRHRIFYALCVLYSLGALLFAYALQDPSIGLANEQLSGARFIGWLWYAFVESFASLMVGLFWSFASDISTPDSAKRGFSVIAIGAQVGGVTGPLLIYPVAGLIGPSYIIVIAAIGMIGIAFQMFYFMKVTPASELVGYHSKDDVVSHSKPKAGFFEGIRLIISQPYLLAIVSIVALYEIVSTIIELHMKIFASEVFTDLSDITSFFFKYAFLTNGIALMSLLLGAGTIGRRLGLRKTLLLLPTLIGMGVVCIWFAPRFWMALAILVTIKGLNYALNQPAKEQLYVPTSRTSKYKAKAWIDSFGSRFSKTAGSSIHMFRTVLQSSFVTVSSLISIALIGLWVAAALFVSREHAKAIEEGRELC